MSYNPKTPFTNAPRVRLGDYIRRSTVNNKDLKYGVDLIQGVTNEGKFSIPKGSTLEIDLKPYKLVYNGAFVYNPSRLNIGSLAYRTEGFCIVSHLYIVFYLNDKGKRRINPEYLYLYFRRDEFYREVTFRNFGSQRPEFNFNDMSELEIPLPDIMVQQKYVDIYKAMVANQQSYERGLEDLKLAIDITIDKLKNNAHRVRIGALLREVDNRNTDKSVVNVQGININKQFMPTVANTTGTNLTNYKVVTKGQFAFSGMQTGRDMCIRIALYDKEEPIIISPAYTVLQTNSSEVISEYIMIWFSRKESDRFGWFLSDASIRSNLDLDSFFDTKIPLPDISIQKSIADIYKVYATRKQINEQLKEQIKNICPILIKGSLEEGK